MAKFLTTSGTSHHIENIILGAKKELFLVSPYLQISKTFFERLRDASNRGVSITIIYGKNNLQEFQLRSLQEIKNIQLYFFENLHAKCYFNEANMVITSMNMYEFSEKNNREMGILIQRKKDEDIFIDAVMETSSILESAFHMRNGNLHTQSTQGFPKNIQKGFCIRCETKIPYDPEKPYCRDCYYSWSEWENYDYVEKICHCCGKPEPTSMMKPECYKCYRDN